MSQSNQSNEYNRLFEKYNKMSNEELSEIVKPESGYTELAVKVASDILKSDRTEYYKNLKPIFKDDDYKFLKTWLEVIERLQKGMEEC